MSEEIERRIQALAAREEVVESVRKEVEGVFEVSAKSKADLEFVEEHRADVLALKTRVDELVASIRDSETRLADISAKKRLVDEVQLKVGVITNLLEDVRVNMETVGEQRAVLDHVMENLSKLNEMVASGQSTLRALQAERELAERIERGIKALRSKTA
jgi:predicted  nucleic acid-binding Zn-ribbon protein